MSRSTYRPRTYGTRGEVQYFRPDGWWQFRIPPWYLSIDGSMPARIEFEEIRSWPIAYHGTKCEKLPPILKQGLRKPGELPWLCSEHGQARAGPDLAVYLSPSLWYASHPVYSPLKKIKDELWIQVVLKLRVRPGSYRVEKNTLGRRHWDLDVVFDPNFPSHFGLEWLLEGSTKKRCDAVIVGLMLREVGAEACAETFGRCPSLAGNSQPPEYEWTGYLLRRFREGGFLVDGTSCTSSTTSTTSSTTSSTTTSSTTTSSTAVAANALDSEYPIALDSEYPMVLSSSASSLLDSTGLLQAEHRIMLACRARSIRWIAVRTERLLRDQVICSLVKDEPLRNDGDAILRYKNVLCDLISHARMGTDLEVEHILRWHGLCMQGLHGQAGLLRTTAVRVGRHKGLAPALVTTGVLRYVQHATQVAVRGDISALQRRHGARFTL